MAYVNFAKAMGKNDAQGNFRQFSSVLEKGVRTGQIDGRILEEALRYAYNAGKSDLCDHLSGRGITDYQAEIYFEKEEAHKNVERARTYFDRVSLLPEAFGAYEEKAIRRGVDFMLKFV